jgi:hypothetical protein
MTDTLHNAVWGKAGRFWVLSQEDMCESSLNCLVQAETISTLSLDSSCSCFTGCGCSFVSSFFVNTLSDDDRLTPGTVNSHLASREIPRFLWNLTVYYFVHKSPPLVKLLPSTRPCITFLIVRVSYVEELLPLAQPPKWRTTLFRLSATACSIYSQLPSVSGDRHRHPQPEDAPCRGDRDPLYMEVVMIWK